MRIAFLTNIVSPYRAPLFAELDRTPGWSVRVLVNAENEHDRRWSGVGDGIDVQVSRSLTIHRRVRPDASSSGSVRVATHVPMRLWSDLRAYRPDVVVTHELGPRSAVGAAYAARHRLPLVLWSYQSQASKAHPGVLRRAVRRALLERADAIVGMGRQARSVLLDAGCDPARLFDAPNAPDHAALDRRLAAPLHGAGLESMRRRFGGDGGKRVALVIGRLNALKGIDETVAAWHGLPAAIRDGWNLVFVGEGPLANRVTGLDDEGIVHAGYVDHHALADVYAASDLHLFASLGDVWGLVVNEAMWCGVPTLCSTRAGCVDDLIDDGLNGWRFDAADPASFRRGLQRALTTSDLAPLGRVARATARRFDILRMAEGFRAAIRHAVRRRARGSAA